MEPCLAALGRHPASAVFIWNVAATSGPAQQLWQSLVGRLDSVIGHIVTAVDSADPEDIRSVVDRAVKCCHTQAPLGIALLERSLSSLRRN